MPNVGEENVHWLSAGVLLQSSKSFSLAAPLLMRVIHACIDLFSSNNVWRLYSKNMWTEWPVGMLLESRRESGGHSTSPRPTWLSEICWKIYVEICWETCCWGIFSWTGSKKHNMMEQCCEYRVDILMRALSKKLKHIAAKVDWNHPTAPKHRSNISQEHSSSLNNIQPTSFNILLQILNITQNKLWTSLNSNL